MTRPAALAAACLLVLAGCGDSGSPAAPSPAPSGARTIEIEAQDSLRFDPDELTVSVGETIQFVVTNAGSGDHEFVLGDAEVQEAHEDAHGGHGGDDALATLDLPRGTPQTAIVTFEAAGEVLYGCHIDGHYGAGMVGTITVTG